MAPASDPEDWKGLAATVGGSKRIGDIPLAVHEPPKVENGRPGFLTTDPA